MKKLILSILIMTSLMLMVVGGVSAEITTITVTSPNGGEYLSGTQNIEWDWTGGEQGDIVNIVFSTDDFSSQAVIATNVAFDSSPFLWDTSAFLDDSNYKVRFIDDSILVYDTSNAFFTIDNTEPTASVVINGGEEYIKSQDVTLTLTFDDETSGVKECRYANEDLSWTNWDDCINGKQWTLTNEDGEKTVYYEVKDNAENVKKASDTITLDTTDPTVDLTPDPPKNPTVYESSLKITLECQDDNGCEKIGYDLSDTCSKNVGDYIVTMGSSTSFDISSPTDICTYAKDSVGNEYFSISPVYYDNIYTNIQDAITGAGNGEIINIESGTYIETLNLQGKTLTINGAGIGSTTIDASTLTGYAISNFGDSTTISGLTLIGTPDNYGFKVSHVSGITLENIRVENSKKTGIDLNTVNGATLTNIEVVNTVSGFGLMILDSNNVDVTDITTSGNPWGGVSVQTKNAVSNNVVFSGTFNAGDNFPLLLEQDPDASSNYYSITNVQLPSKFGYVVYDFRDGGDNYKQWYYFETLDTAKTVAQGFASSADPVYSDITIYGIIEENYYVEEGMLIQDAIDAATAGNTINVAAGTYNEGIITINKDLTIIGDSLDKPIINPTEDTGLNNEIGPNGRGWFQITQADVIFHNLVFDGTGKNIRTVVHYHEDSTAGKVENCDFRNIRHESQYYGRGINNYGQYVEVINSTFENIQRIGVFTFNPTAKTLIKGCVYTGKGIGDYLDYGFEAGNGATIIVEDNTVTNCKGVASSDGSTSAGILVTTYYGPSTEATITNNIISDSSEAIAVGYDASDTSIVVANYNRITGNNHGITSTNPYVNAKDNWWGTNDGDIIATMVEGNVDYTPWAYAGGLYDNEDPTSTINFPVQGSLFAFDFVMNITDLDFGDAGLNPGACEYQVTSNDIITKHWTSRDCGDSKITITVGDAKDCNFEGEGVCKVEVKSVDNSGNDAFAERTFSIDWTNPPQILNSGPSGTVVNNWTMLHVETNKPATCRYDIVYKSSYDAMNYEMETTGGVYHSNRTELLDKSYAYYVLCEDNAGNEMIQTVTILFDVDTRANFTVTIPETKGDYLSEGWNQFFLPSFVLEDTTLISPYMVETVLQSIDGNYDMLYHFDGTGWKSYVPDREVNDLPEFPEFTEFNGGGFPYFIYMNVSGERIELV